jgi:glutamate-1-semialdehyde 2,1-aminomutase
MGEPNSGGVPKALAELTITLEYNNTEQLKTVMSEIGSEVACVIIEPIAGNMNLIPANVDFIKTLREECDKNGVVLIFDEVMSGFRARLGGASEYFGITPDLTTLGKVIGGGLPVGAFGGKREIMEVLLHLVMFIKQARYQAIHFLLVAVWQCLMKLVKMQIFIKN